MKQLFLVLLFFVNGVLFGQHQDVFPGISGEPLLDSLVQHYKPDSVLAWTAAKDTIFAVIDLQNDTVTCVYTGLQKWLDPLQDPDTYMSNNNDPNGMNIEHSYPQSKGAASGNARSDMHHLFPTRSETNNMRGNLPFDELDDQLVTNWFYLHYNSQGVPAFNIDLYSELINTVAFEPREDFKGNVARAMFYFFTMYENEAMAVDTGFFNLQKDVLCQWHFQDPVDQAEWDRSYRVAAYQDSLPNPFVLDCSLAKRTFCSSSTVNCLTSVRQPQAAAPAFELGALAPNPLRNQAQLSYRLHEPMQVKASLYNLLGQQMLLLMDEQQATGRYQLDIQAKETWPKGLYMLRLEVKNNRGEQMQLIQKIHIK